MKRRYRRLRCRATNKHKHTEWEGMKREKKSQQTVPLCVLCVCVECVRVKCNKIANLNDPLWIAEMNSNVMGFHVVDVAHALALTRSLHFANNFRKIVAYRYSQNIFSNLLVSGPPPHPLVLLSICLYFIQIWTITIFTAILSKLMYSIFLRCIQYNDVAKA